MADTTLKAYIAELKLLLEQEALEEVMGHCRHILQHFPKNVETYRFLGRALLEKNRHQEAGDVFQRVLSALPEDFVAHLGLSAVGEEAGQLPLAIWHLERAYEQEPNNGALRDEIRRLYEKRDGIAPERLQVTLGGLAHSYVRGRLYEQAITELTKALTEAPDRVDLRLLLTQVLWESDRFVESADEALLVLEQLPDSIDANRIMSLLWLKASRPSDAAPFVSRLEQLDPFLAWKVVNPDKELPRDAFSLPHLDWDVRAAAAMATDVPDWVSSIGNVFEAPDSVSLSNDWAEPQVPTPSRKPQSGLLRAKGNTDLFANSDVFSRKDEAPEEPVEIPDWFDGTSSTPSDAPAMPNEADDVPDWFKDASPEPTSSVDVPSWMDDVPDMDDLTDNQLPSGFTDLLAGSGAQMPAQAAPSSAAAPSWLDEDESAEAPVAAPLDAMSWLNTGPLSSPDQPATASPASDEDLDWMLADADSSAAPEATATGEPLDAMSWLNTGPLSSPEPATAEDSLDAPAEAPLDAMSWLNTGSLPSLDEPEAISEPVEDSIETEMEAPADVPLDAMSWLNTGSLPSLDEPETISEPVEDSIETNEAAPLDAMSWLNTDSLRELPLPESDPEPKQDETVNAMSWLDAEDDQPDFDWMSDSTAEEAAPAENAQPDPISWFQDSADTSEDVVTTDEESSEELLAEAGDAPDWLSRLAPAEANQPVSQSGGSSDTELEEDWLTSFETGSLAKAAPPAAAENSWMPADAQDDFENLLQNTAAQANQPRVVGESGQLDLSTLPDWMNAFPENENAAPESATLDDMDLQPAASTNSPDWLSSMGMQLEPEAATSDDLDFGSNTPAEPAGNAPDWLSSMGMQLEPEATSSDNLDFGGNAPAEPAGDAPDWLSSMGMQLEPEATSSDNSDFGSNTPAEPAGDAPDWLSSMGMQLEPEAAPSDNLDFGSLDSVSAEPTGDSSDWLSSMAGDAEPATPVTSSMADFDFTSFDSGPAEPAGDAPDWLSSMAAPAEAGDAPDWLSAMAAPAETSSTPAASLDDLDFGEMDSAPAEPAGDAPDWLSAMAAPAEASSAPAASLDDLDFGEMDSAPAEPAGDAPDWLSAMAAPAETSSTPAASLDDFDFGEVESAVAEPAGDAPDWLSAMAPAAETSSTPAASLDDFDFGEIDSAPAEPAGDAPDWLSAMATPAETSSTPAASLDDFDFGEVESAAAEPAGDAPDWLSAMAPAAETSSAPAASLDDFDFGEMDSAAAEPAGDAPDWLSAMAPAAEASSVPAASLDDFDFGEVESAAAEPAGDAPDWLSAMAPVAETSSAPAASLDDFDFGEVESAPAEPTNDEPDWLAVMAAPADEPTAQSNARHAMPEHFPEVDLSKLPEDESTTSADQSEDYEFSFNRVAQPANLVNTNAQTDSQSFSFKRKPAWMRKSNSTKK